MIGANTDTPDSQLGGGQGLDDHQLSLGNRQLQFHPFEMGQFHQVPTQFFGETSKKSMPSGTPSCNVGNSARRRPRPAPEYPKILGLDRDTGGRLELICRWRRL
jgi:hypothetical protein